MKEPCFNIFIIIKLIANIINPLISHLSLKAAFLGAMVDLGLFFRTVLFIDKNRLIKVMPGSSIKNGVATIPIRNRRDTMLKSVRETISVRKKRVYAEVNKRDIKKSL
jgi:hypothetical protein